MHVANFAGEHRGVQGAAIVRGSASCGRENPTAGAIASIALQEARVGMPLFDPDKLYTFSELSALVKCHRRTLERMVKSGRLPAPIRFGRMKFLGSELNAAAELLRRPLDPLPRRAGTTKVKRRMERNNGKA
jgi:excisionase family DNA binding protein